LLFNLLVLGSLTDIKGYVWRRKVTDLYVVECLPVILRNVSSFTTSCLVCSLIQYRALFVHTFILNKCVFYGRPFNKAICVAMDSEYSHLGRKYVKVSYRLSLWFDYTKCNLTRFL